MTDFKIKMAELAKKYNISHKRDIDWHNFVYEVQQLSRPELRESEDERIRRELVEYLKGDLDDITTDDTDRWINWLEKQKEQKPVEWCEVELEFRGEKVKVKRPFFRDDNGRGYSTTEQDEEVSWNALRAWCEKKGISLYDLYPKVEWSEEDEKMLARIIERGQSQIQMFDTGLLPEHIAWLKSLRPQSHWKPSEEQMRALLNAEGYLREGDQFDSAKSIAQLYEQLKKLKEDKQ